MNNLLPNGSIEVQVALQEGRLEYASDGGDLIAGGSTPDGTDTGCSRDTYKLSGEYQPGSGSGSGLYVSPGDGSNPAGATDAEFRDRIVAALDEITTATGCGYTSDTVNIDYTVNPETIYETDFVVNSNGNHVCAGYFDTDGVSTIDAGNLDDPGADAVGKACVWYAAPNGPILESDIRLNISNYNFTLSPGASSCSNDYDLRSVLTHELGHSYGLSDIGPDYSVGTTADKYLTMYQSSFTCRSWARSLGKGDILALKALY
jgi:hypothetical protein